VGDMNSTASYTKLKDGTWGIRVQGAARAGATVNVSRRDGSSKTKVVGRVIWAGGGVSICSIDSTASGPRSSQSSRRGARGTRGTWTGCACGSVEEYERPGDCRSCQHDR